MWCAYTILVCAVYWVCECTPLAITSMIPVIILPLAGTSLVVYWCASHSIFIKSSIYTCRTDMYQMMNHLHQKIRSN